MDAFLIINCVRKKISSILLLDKKSTLPYAGNLTPILQPKACEGSSIALRAPRSAEGGDLVNLESTAEPGLTPSSVPKEEIRLKIYSNLKLDRIQILNEHRGKVSGVYCLINLINGHFYIGSSTNIATRMRNYFNKSFLEKKKKKKKKKK